MHKKLLAVSALVLLLGAACGDSDDAGDAEEETTTTEVTDDTGGDGDATTTTAAPLEGEALEVATAWETFFTAGDDAGTYLEATADTAAILTAASAAAGSAGTVTAKVTAVAIDGDIATVTFDVLLDGTAALPGATGVAVKQEGQWKMSLNALCALLTLQSAAPPECANYAEAPTA